MTNNAISWTEHVIRLFFLLENYLLARGDWDTGYELDIVTNSRAEPQKPRQWKSMLIHQGWFTALYTQHLLDSQSLEFEICILQALNILLIRFTNVFSKGGYPVTLLPPPRRLVPSLGLGTTRVRRLRSGSCHHPTAATKCNEQPS